MGRAQHLDDDRLIDCYYAQRRADAIDPPTAEHIADCAECEARFLELAGLLDAVRREADIETDAVFTAEHLRAQRLEIARKIEIVGHAARVITFPERFVRRHMSAPAARTATRWIAAAAVAGLLVGVGVGVLYDSERHVFHAAAQITARARPAAITGHQMNAPLAPRAEHLSSPAPQPAVMVTPADAAFLSDLDVAGQRPHTQALQALDALTPHVREVSIR